MDRTKVASRDDEQPLECSQYGVMHVCRDRRRAVRLRKHYGWDDERPERRVSHGLLRSRSGAHCASPQRWKLLPDRL